MKRLSLALILIAGPALAQQSAPSPEFQAIQQMFAASQQQEFALRVEVVRLKQDSEALKAENHKLQEKAEKPATAPSADAGVKPKKD